MLQEDLYLLPLWGPSHGNSIRDKEVGDMTLGRPTGIHMLVTIYQTTVRYKPDLVEHFRLTLVTFLAPVH
jgi:hypothetical protein